MMIINKSGFIKKNLFLISYIACIIILFSITFVIAGPNYYNYDNSTDTAMIYALNKHVANLTLITPKNIELAVPKGQKKFLKIAELDAIMFDNKITEPLMKFGVYDIKKSLSKVDKNIFLMYSDTCVEKPVYESICKNISNSDDCKLKWLYNQTICSNWKEFKDNKILYNKVVRLGLFANVSSNDVIEWIPDILGSNKYRITEWASWNVTFEEDLKDVFTFEEASGNLVDVWDYVNNGTPSGSLDYEFLGKNNYGWRFSRDSNDFITIASNESYYGNSLTWCGWFNFTDTADMTMVSKGTSSAPAGKGTIRMSKRAGNGGYCSSLRDDGCEYVTANGADGWTMNVWYFQCCVFNTADKKVYLYVNGALDATSSTAGSDYTLLNESDIIIGKQAVTNNEEFNGTMDELMFWNEAKGATFIESLYDSGAGTFYEPPAEGPGGNEIPLFYNITLSPANGTQLESGYVDISVNINRTNGTAGVQFDNINYTLSNLTYTGSLFNTTNSSLANGTYPYFFWAFGNVTGNYTSSSTYYYTINSLIEYPQFSSIEDNNNTFTDSGIVNINATITSTNGTAYLLFKGAKYMMTNDSFTGSKFNTTFSFSQNGNFMYNITAYGNGTYNNPNTTNNYYFHVNASVSLKNPRIVGTFINTTSMDGIRGLAFNGDRLLFGTSASRNSMTIINITSDGNVEQISSFVNETSIGGAFGIVEQNNLVYVSNGAGIEDNGFAIINVTDPSNPVQIAHLTNTTSMAWCRSLDVEGNYLTIASYSPGFLTIVNVTDPYNPVQVSSYTNDRLSGTNLPIYMKVYDDIAYVVTNDKTLEIVNITDKSNPAELGYYYNSSMESVRTVDVDYPLVYIGGFDDDFRIINVTNPASPVDIGNYVNSTAIDTTHSIQTEGNYAFVLGANSNSLSVMNMTDKTNPVQIGYIQDAVNLDNPFMSHYKNQFIYVSILEGDGISIIEVGNPYGPKFYENATFVNFRYSPPNGTDYAIGRNYNFNVTINNSNGTAWFQFNNINYSVTNYSDDFTSTINNLEEGNYPYIWGSYSSSSGEMNTTLVNYYTVAINNSVSECRNFTTANTTYTLISNVNATGMGIQNSGCFVIKADGVVIDGAGYELFSDNQNSYIDGIYSEKENLTIKNLIVNNINKALWFQKTCGKGYTLYNNSFYNLYEGIKINSCQMFQFNITENYFINASQYSLFLSSDDAYSGCSFSESLGTYILNNTFINGSSNSEVSSLGTTYIPTWGTILMTYAYNTTIKNNNFYNQTVTNSTSIYLIDEKIGSNLSIEDNLFDNIYYALGFKGSFNSNLTIKDNEIINSGAGEDIWIVQYNNNNNITIQNLTGFDDNILSINAGYGGRNITLRWYVNLNIKNSTSVNLENVNVTITDSNGDLVYNRLTDSSGNIPIGILTESIKTNITDYLYTPHKVNLSLTGYANRTVTYNLTFTDNINADLELTNLGEIPDNEYPQFFNSSFSPANNTQFDNGYLDLFININSTNGTSGVDFDNVNYSIENLSYGGSLFNYTNFSISNGTYSYYFWSYGNGTDNNYNSSKLYYYYINYSVEYPQFSNFVTEPINASQYLFGKNYVFNVTTTHTNGTVFLQLDNTNYTIYNNTLTNYNLSNIDLNVSTFRWYVGGWSNGTTARFNSSSWNYVTVLTNTSNGQLFINHTQSNLIYSLEAINIPVNVSSPTGVQMALYINSTLLANETTSYSNLTNFTWGFFNISALFYSDLNHSARWVTYNLNVTNYTSPSPVTPPPGGGGGSVVVTEAINFSLVIEHKTRWKIKEQNNITIYGINESGYKVSLDSVDINFDDDEITYSVKEFNDTFIYSVNPIIRENAFVLGVDVLAKKGSEKEYGRFSIAVLGEKFFENIDISLQSNESLTSIWNWIKDNILIIGVGAFILLGLIFLILYERKK